MYEVIVRPPLLAGAVNATEACALPAVTPVIVGAPGGPVGVTPGDDATDAGPVPALFVAVTVNV